MGPSAGIHLRWGTRPVPARFPPKTGKRCFLETYSFASSSRTSAHRAILDLKIQRDKLHQYQKKITAITTRETEIAKECLKKGDKRRALLALRRKKYQESLLQKTDAQLAQLEMLTSDVEFALVQKDVLFGLQQGTNVLKEIHREMGGIENVEKLMGESEEAQAYQKVGGDSWTWQDVTVLTSTRKSAKCSPEECRTRTRTKSRTSSTPSRPK